MSIFTSIHKIAKNIMCI